MPFDNSPSEVPQTDTELVPFTLPHFARWLGTMPGDKRYEYYSCATCAVGQYLVAHSMKPDGRNYEQFLTPEMRSRIVHPLFNESLTFGQAAKNARALAALGMGR